MSERAHVKREKLTLNKKPSCEGQDEHRVQRVVETTYICGCQPSHSLHKQVRIQRQQEIILTLPIRRLITLHPPSQPSFLAALRKSAEQFSEHR